MACGPVLRGGYGEWVSENDVFQSSSTFSQTADQKKLFEAIAVAMHAWLATLHRHHQVRLRHTVLMLLQNVAIDLICACGIENLYSNDWRHQTSWMIMLSSQH